MSCSHSMDGLGRILASQKDAASQSWLNDSGRRKSPTHNCCSIDLPRAHKFLSSCKVVCIQVSAGFHVFRSKTVTHSTWGVWGNISTGCALTSWYTCGPCPFCKRNKLKWVSVSSQKKKRKCLRWKIVWKRTEKDPKTAKMWCLLVLTDQKTAAQSSIRATPIFR
jgi:hypothetical protein